MLQREYELNRREEPCAAFSSALRRVVEPLHRPGLRRLPPRRKASGGGGSRGPRIQHRDQHQVGHSDQDRQGTGERWPPTVHAADPVRHRQEHQPLLGPRGAGGILGAAGIVRACNIRTGSIAGAKRSGASVSGVSGADGSIAVGKEDEKGEGKEMG